MQQSDILFPEKHSTIYFELLAEHIQYDQMEILRSGTWGLNYLYKSRQFCGLLDSKIYRD